MIIEAMPSTITDTCWCRTDIPAIAMSQPKANETTNILPFDYAKLHRDVGDSKNHNRGKLLFTGFSPGAFIGGGIYHDFKRKKHPLRVSLGLEYGYFDFFYAYRHGRIYGQRLSSFVDTGRT